MPQAVVVEAWVFIAAVAVAVYLIQAGTMTDVISWALGSGSLFAGVIAGSLYSTFVTTPLAVAALIGLGNALQIPLWQVAIVGAIGATISDLALARFLRSPLSLYVVERVLGHYEDAFQRGIRRSMFIRWGVVALGGLLVSLPVPTDELGIALFDASGLRLTQMVPIFLVANFIAIFTILTFVHVFISV